MKQNYYIVKNKTIGGHKKNEWKVECKANYEKVWIFFCNTIIYVCSNNAPPGALMDTSKWRSVKTPATLTSSQSFKRKLQ